MEPLQLKFVATPQDYVSATRAMRRVARIGKEGPGIQVFFVTMLFIAILFLLPSLIGTFTIWQFAGLFVTLGVAALIPVEALVIGPYLAGYRRKKSGTRLGFTTWYVTDSKIEIRFPEQTTPYAWSYFKKIYETRDYYLLIPPLNKRTAFQFVPKRAFHSEELEIAFCRYLETHIGPIIKRDRVYF